MYHVVGYIRVSGEAQDLERRRALIKNYCTRNGYHLIKIIEDNAGFAVTSGPRTTGDGYCESCILGPEGIQIEVTA